jgi:hypothetical protein
MWVDSMLYQTSSPSFFPAFSKAESIAWEYPVLEIPKATASRQNTKVETSCARIIYSVALL